MRDRTKVQISEGDLSKQLQTTTEQLEGSRQWQKLWLISQPCLGPSWSEAVGWRGTSARSQPASIFPRFPYPKSFPFRLVPCEPKNRQHRRGHVLSNVKAHGRLFHFCPLLPFYKWENWTQGSELVSSVWGAQRAPNMGLVSVFKDSLCHLEFIVWAEFPFTCPLLFLINLHTFFSFLYSSVTLCQAMTTKILRKLLENYCFT